MNFATPFSKTKMEYWNIVIIGFWSDANAFMSFTQEKHDPLLNWALKDVEIVKNSTDAFPKSVKWLFERNRPRVQLKTPLNSN